MRSRGYEVMRTMRKLGHQSQCCEVISQWRHEVKRHIMRPWGHEVMKPWALARAPLVVRSWGWTCFCCILIYFRFRCPPCFVSGQVATMSKTQKRVCLRIKIVLYKIRFFFHNWSRAMSIGLFSDQVVNIRCLNPFSFKFDFYFSHVFENTCFC